MRPLQPELFYHDGRGPRLHRVYWSRRGALLQGIEYYLPDSAGPEDIAHVRFVAAQVVSITPEEVIDYRRNGDGLIEFRPAALFDLGRSDWLRSFAPQHLANCTHLQLFFYDELFDVICEGAVCARAPLLSNAAE